MNEDSSTFEIPDYIMSRLQPGIAIPFPDRKDELNFHTLATMPDYGRIRFEKRDVDMSLFKARGEHFEKFGVIERRY
jgi:hypothetical protein